MEILLRNLINSGKCFEGKEALDIIKEKYKSDVSFLHQNVKYIECSDFKMFKDFILDIGTNKKFSYGVIPITNVNNIKWISGEIIGTEPVCVLVVPNLCPIDTFYFIGGVM